MFCTREGVQPPSSVRGGQASAVAGHQHWAVSTKTDATEGHVVAGEQVVAHRHCPEKGSLFSLVVTDSCHTGHFSVLAVTL